MNYTIIFLLLFVCVLSILITIEVDMNVNVIKCVADIKIKIMHLKILKIEIGLYGLTLKLNGSKKVKSINLFKIKQENYIIKQIKTSVISKLYLEKLDVGFRLGLIDSKYTSQINGLLLLFNNMIAINNVNNDMDYCIHVMPDYVNNCIALKGYAKIYLTLFDMIFAIVMSIYKGKQYAKR